jgi:hypothetical protein
MHTATKMTSNDELTAEGALNILENVTEKSGKLGKDLQKDILTAVSRIRNEYVFLKSDVESSNKRITVLEPRAAETHVLLPALLDGVGGNRREEQETSSAPRVNFKDNDWRAADPASGTRTRYSDVAVKRRSGGGGQETTNARVNGSKVRKDEKENYTETRTEERTSNNNIEEEEEGEMEELAGFEAATYRRNRRR